MVSSLPASKTEKNKINAKANENIFLILTSSGGCHKFIFRQTLFLKLLTIFVNIFFILWPKSSAKVHIF